MSELLELERKAIERIKAFEPEEGYYLAFSGGKDSVVCKALLDMANVKYDATYRVTSVDPPELVRFIKDQHPDVIREVPRDKYGNPITMWNLIPRKLIPPHACYALLLLQPERERRRWSNDGNWRSLGGEPQPEKQPRYCNNAYQIRTAHICRQS